MTFLTLTKLTPATEPNLGQMDHKWSKSETAVLIHLVMMDDVGISGAGHLVRSLTRARLAAAGSVLPPGGIGRDVIFCHQRVDIYGFLA
jgi:hypothetical protein